MHKHLCIVHNYLCTTFVHKSCTQDLCTEHRSMHRAVCMDFPCKYWGILTYAQYCLHYYHY